MVKAFGAEVQQSNDPSYIGYSKEGDADRSMKVLFSGVGNLIDQKSEFLEEQQKQQADAAAESIVQAETNTALGGAQGQDTVFGSSAGDTINTEVRNLSVKGQKLTQAYKEGKITSSNYWAQIDSMTRSVKARYPTQADRIDAHVAQALGRRPAAAAIEEAREEWKSSLAEKNEEEKAFNRFVDTNIEYLPPDYFVRQNENRPYTKIETRHYVMERQKDKQAIEAKRSKLALAKEQGNLNEEEATATALDEVTGYVNRVIVDTSETSKNFQQLMSDARTKGKDFNPDQQMALRRSFAALKFQVQEGVEGILSKAWADNSSTYYNQIKSPEKIKHIKESALARLDYYEKLMNDKDYGLLNSDVIQTRAMKDEVNRRILESSNSIRVYQAIKDIGGQDLLNDLLLSKDGQKLKSDAAKAIANVAIGRVLSGDAKSLNDEMSRSKGANVGGEGGKMNFDLIKKSVDSLVSPKATPQIQANVANALFGPANIRFLENIKPEQKMDVYTRLTAPEVTKTMQKLGETDPTLWQNYREWAKLGFGQTFTMMAKDLQEGIAMRPGMNIQWDPKAKRFNLQLTKDAEKYQGTLVSEGSFWKAREQLFSGNISKSVNNFNRQIAALEPILAAEGQDIGDELLGFLRSLGIDEDAPKEFSFFTKAAESLLRTSEKYKPKEGGEEAGKKR